MAHMTQVEMILEEQQQSIERPKKNMFKSIFKNVSDIFQSLYVYFSDTTYTIYKKIFRMEPKTFTITHHTADTNTKEEMIEIPSEVVEKKITSDSHA